MTITGIAERAGMTVTALYRYCPKEQAIIRELAVRTFAHDGQAVVEPLLTEIDEVGEMVRQGVWGYWELNRQEPFRRNLRVAVLADAELAGLDFADNARNAELLARRAADVMGRDDVEAIAETLTMSLALLDGLIQLTARLPEGEAERAVDAFSRMITHVLTHPH